MEFHENKAKTPFIRLVQLWQAVRRWRRQMQARRVLQQMGDERLRDIGLRREDVECEGGKFPFPYGEGERNLAWRFATNHPNKILHLFLFTRRQLAHLAQ